MVSPFQIAAQKEEENKKSPFEIAQERRNYVDKATGGNPFDKAMHKKMTGEDLKPSPFRKKLAEQVFDDAVENNQPPPAVTPAFVTEDNFFKAYYKWLHMETPEASGAWDWLTRVVPKSLAGTTVGLVEFPYLTIKSFTDPLIGLVDDMFKGKEKKKATKDRSIELGKNALELANGMGEFFGEAVGMYGWEKFKKKWTSDPAAGLVAVAPIVKGLRTPVRTSVIKPFGEYSKGKIKRAGQKLYDKIYIMGPYERAGKPGTGIAMKLMHSVKISEQNFALHAAKGIQKLKLTPEEGMQVTLNVGRSKASIKGNKKVDIAAKIVEDYYKQAYKRLKKENAIGEKWPQSQIDRNATTISKMASEIKGLHKILLEEKNRGGIKKIKTKERIVKEKTEKTKTTNEVSGDGIIERTKLAEVWENRVIDALKERGFSAGEAGTAIEHIRGAGGEVGAEITKIIKEKTTEKIKIEKIVETYFEKIKPNRAKIKRLKTKILDKTIEINSLKKLNKELIEGDFKYNHIPMDAWFDKIREAYGDPVGTEIINKAFRSRLFKGRFFHGRKTPDIGSIIYWLRDMKGPTGKPIFTPADFDVRIIMGRYASKAGNIRGFGKIFKAAYKDGLIIRKTTNTPPHGYTNPSPNLEARFPELRGKYIHNAFDTNMVSYADKIGKSMHLGRIMGYTKMMGFANPLILPAYDLYQAAWAGTLNPLRPIKTAKNFKKGIQSYIKKDKTFHEAQDAGAFSTPFSPPFENFMKDMSKTLEGRMLHRIASAAVERGKNPFKLIDDAYRLEWNMAWGGDGMIRMATYNYLKDKGFKPIDAGQMTAYFHGDYAMITPAARRIANRIFFTPSFKLAMGHLQANMIKSSVQIMRDAANLKKPSAKTKMLAKGALILYASQQAKDYMFKQWGFKKEASGFKYYKTVETDEGEKEIVIYNTDPGNVILRQVHRWTKWQDDPDRLGAIMNKAHWDLHPLGSLVYELAKNTDGENPIWNPFDKTGKWNDGHIIAKDILHHSIRKIVAMERMVEDYTATKGPKASYEALRNDMGKLHTYFISATSLAYLRQTKDQRKMRQLKNWERLYKKYFFIDQPKTDEEYQRRIDTFFRETNNILNEMFEHE